MKDRISRASGLFRRYRVDRRLPPTVLDLMTTTMMLRRQAAVGQSASLARPVIGAVEHAAASAPVVRRGSRRYQSSGPLVVPYSSLTHQFARHVIDSLMAASLDPFLVDRHGDSLQFGLPLRERSLALRVLAESTPSSGWYLDWADGRRSGTLPLGDSASDRHARRARQWRVYRIDAVGDGAAGPEQAVEISFWEIGTSGAMEMVGSRGQQRFDLRCPESVEKIDGHEYPGRTAFPIEHGLERFTEPIDAVYTWVDGADEHWRSSFEKWSIQERRDLLDPALDPARYHSRDELKYSLRSLWAHCGWVRNVYVVTSGQVPSWLIADDRIRIVNHSEILPSSALPTFNSHAIESALHRIEGLSEHFLYLNDDVFVGRSLRPEHFFEPNGIARVFQSDARVPGVEDTNMQAVDMAARRGREILETRFGRVVGYKPLHTVFALRRSVMDEIDIEFDEIVNRTAHSRFRSSTDLSIAASFAQHYGLAIGKGVLSAIDSDYVHVESGRLSWHLDKLLLGRDCDTFCVNETAHSTADTSDREQALADFFQSYFPIAAPWERGPIVDG